MAFGVKKEADKTTLTAILRDTDTAFLKWAITQIVAWENTSLPINTTHIHPEKDRILPIRFVKCDLVIENSGHLFTLTHTETLNEILKKMVSI